jgi:signal transduction histidine kinase
VEAHGGTVSFTTRAGKGTTFTVFLPEDGGAGGPKGRNTVAP